MRDKDFAEVITGTCNGSGKLPLEVITPGERKPNKVSDISYSGTYGTGICPVCRVEKSLTSDGVMRRHADEIRGMSVKFLLPKDLYEKILAVSAQYKVEPREWILATIEASIAQINLQNKKAVKKFSDD